MTAILGEQYRVPSINTVEDLYESSEEEMEQG